MQRPKVAASSSSATYGRGRAAFLWNRILHKELEIIGSNASAGAWPEAVHLAPPAALCRWISWSPDACRRHHAPKRSTSPAGRAM